LRRGYSNHWGKPDVCGPRYGCGSMEKSGCCWPYYDETEPVATDVQLPGMARA